MLDSGIVLAKAKVILGFIWNCALMVLAIQSMDLAGSFVAN